MAAKQLGSLAVGSTVKLQEHGTAVEFLIPQQGNPDPELYESSFNQATWLLRRDLYSECIWSDSANGSFVESDVFSAICDEATGYLNALDPAIRSSLIAVDLGYQTPLKVFPLSLTEYGLTIAWAEPLGTTLEYFKTGGNARRIARLNQVPEEHWTRSESSVNNHAGAVDVDGTLYGLLCTSRAGTRPALLLPQNLYVDDDGFVIPNQAPAAPASITLPDEIRGGASITVRWAASTDPDDNLAGYTLERSTDGGSGWAQVYQGAETSAADTVPSGAQSVTYRVKAYDAAGAESSWQTSAQATVTNNQPPETPASITLPEEIQGGASITVRWAASTDPDGNLAGYTLERSTDGGSSWAQVYQGAETSTTDTVAFGTQSVIYRVKAYDAAGTESGWRTSDPAAVTNNSAPAAPGSITVPELVKGGQPLAISWAAASDPDENLTGYELERKTDAADWAQVYKGDALSFTDQITKGWLSVQYRVRALDSYNAASGWTESDARTVDNNSAPVITCEHPSGSDLGEKAEPFAVNYTVTDADGDPLTVAETLDDTPTRSEAEVESGAALEAATLNDPAAFQKLLNGPHSLKISASDGKAIAAHNLTFTKKVTSASVTLKEPMAAAEDIYLAVLRVTGSIPADALLTVEVTNNALDDQPVWQDATDEVKRGANIIFENHTAAKGAAFNFRVSVARGPSGEGGYLTSISGAFQ